MASCAAACPAPRMRIPADILARQSPSIRRVDARARNGCQTRRGLVIQQCVPPSDIFHTDSPRTQMAKKAAKQGAAKRPPYRLKEIADEQMSALQRALRDAIYSGPRGIRKKLTGPFQIWLNAPELGHLAQALGAHVRYKTSLSPRLSETAILRHRANLEGALRVVRARADGGKGRREAADRQGHPGRARRRSRRRRTSSRSSISSRRSTRPAASATKPTSACTPSWATPAWSSWSASAATTR